MTNRDLHIRWMLRRDIPEVLESEALCFGAGQEWGEEDYTTELKKINNIGVVAENESDIVVGAMVYSLTNNNTITIRRILVDPEYQGMGVGTSFVNKLREKLSLERRDRIEVFVPERNLPAQLFFKSLGFWGEQSHENIRFIYRLHPENDLP